jgi:hypothetical protein
MPRSGRNRESLTLRVGTYNEPTEEFTEGQQLEQSYIEAEKTYISASCQLL